MPDLNQEDEHSHSDFVLEPSGTERRRQLVVVPEDESSGGIGVKTTLGAHTRSYGKAETINKTRSIFVLKEKTEEQRC